MLRVLRRVCNVLGQSAGGGEHPAGRVGNRRGRGIPTGVGVLTAAAVRNVWQRGELVTAIGAAADNAANTGFTTQVLSSREYSQNGWQAENHEVLT